jgi:hypothetical protein
MCSSARISDLAADRFIRCDVCYNGDMATHPPHRDHRSRFFPFNRLHQRRRVLIVSSVLTLLSAAFWFYASITEFQTGRRLWPWSAYALCGHTPPASLPQHVRIGLYEEFPNPWRLAKLQWSALYSVVGGLE